MNAPATKIRNTALITDPAIAVMRAFALNASGSLTASEIIQATKLSRATFAAPWPCR